MSSRSTKRRRLNRGGEYVKTQLDSLSENQESADSGYFLRSISSARSNKKRRFMSIKEEAEENADNVEPAKEAKEPKQAKLSKLGTIKKTIASAINKMTSTKQDPEPEQKQDPEEKQPQPQSPSLSRPQSPSEEKQKPPREGKYEHDAKGYIMFHRHLLLSGRYSVQRRLGKGTFSKVFACRDLEAAADGAHREVVIKVIRNQHKYRVAARTELRMLELLRRHDAGNELAVIKLLASGDFRSHPLLVFPLYGRSLYHYLYDNDFRPFPDSHIKDISRQVVSAVHFAHSLGIIITNLKPENIIICDDASDRHLLGDKSVYHTLKSHKVRLIDFGSAVFDDGSGKQTHHHLIQTRHYRAPEVMLKRVEGWSFAADVWSVGCVMVELANGRMLFNTHDTIDHLHQIATAIGQMLLHIQQAVPEAAYNELFHFDGRLALHRATRSAVQCGKLKQYFHDKYHHKIYDLVKKMLDWDPDTRISAEQALKHPLFKE